MDRRFTYFVSDVHLGLDLNDKDGREARFVKFLQSIPKDETEALYMLGDIWDFWYEYRDVVPKGYVRVLAALMDLVDAGVKVYFFEGNHDIWTYKYFEELGMKKLQQPYVVEIGDKTFCIGHGDGLGKGMRKYKFMKWIFTNKVIQALFSTLHPWIAFRLGNGWSKSKRKHRDKRNFHYVFKGESEPLYQYALQMSSDKHIDYFIFGHYHSKVDLTLPTGSRLMIMDSWIHCSPYVRFDRILSNNDFFLFEGGGVV